MRKYIIGCLFLALGSGLLLLNFYFSQSKIISLREPILAMLVDPKSAEFKAETNFGAEILCGEINAKNRLGGYTGFKKFVRTPKFVHIEGAAMHRFSATAMDSADDLINRLDIKIKFNEDQIKNKNAGLPHILSASQVEEFIDEEVFKNNWKANCTK